MTDLRSAAERLVRRVREFEADRARRGSDESLSWVVEAVDDILRSADDLDDEAHTLRRDLAAARREYARYVDLFSWAPIAYLAADEHGVITEANRSAGFLLGTTSGDLVGCSFADMVVAADRPRFHGAVARARREPVPVVWEARIAPITGDAFWAEVATVARPAGRGPWPLRFGIRDVTVRHREAAEASRALDEAESAEQARAAFLLAVAHDLRSPVNGILAAARALDRVALPDDERLTRVVGAVVANAEALRHVQNQVLDLERFARGGSQPHPRVVRVDHEVEEVLKAVPLGDRSLETDLEPVEARIDPGYVATILRNLVGNAARYTPPLSRVSVRLSSAPEGVLLVVDDDGPGIAPDDRERVFELFTTLDEAGERSGGMGAGLHIVRRFAELHGGRAWVESNDEGGASFRVLLREGGQS